MQRNKPQNYDYTDEKWINTPHPYEEAISEITKQESNTKSGFKNLFILLISLFIFFRLGLLKNGPEDIIIIIFVLIVHEVGHLIGMRLFGYRNVHMFFIPFFGAAVSGESKNVPAYKKAVVSLLGPVPGIALGIAFLIFFIKTEIPIFLQLAIMFLLINSFNLLPFFPLDGGRFLQEVLFSRNRYVELFFRLLASLALIALGFLMGAWLIALLGLFTLLSIGISFKITRIVKDLKPLLSSSDAQHTQTVSGKTIDTERIPPEIAKEIVQKIYQKISSKLKVKTVAAYAKEIWERMHLCPPGLLATIGLLSLYLLSFCLPFVALLSAAAISLSEDNPFTKSKIVEYQKPNGKMSRKEQSYWLGKLSYEAEIADDRLVYHGRGVSYHQNGKVYKEGNWYNGKWNGEWKEYDQQGNLIRVIVFDKGKFISSKELEGERWIDKSWEELPSWLGKALMKHTEGPPFGPKSPSLSSKTKDHVTDN